MLILLKFQKQTFRKTLPPRRNRIRFPDAGRTIERDRHCCRRILTGSQKLPTDVVSQVLAIYGPKSGRQLN